MFLLKLLDENSLLNIFFSRLNVMTKTMENCMAHSRCALLQMLAGKKEKLLCFLHQNNRIKRTFYYIKTKQNMKAEIKLRPINNYSLYKPFTTFLAWSNLS